MLERDENLPLFSQLAAELEQAREIGRQYLKRLGEVRELLPMTAKALDKDFSKLFWQYAETYNPQGIKKHLYDAIAFATYIEKIDNLKPKWIIDLVRYEKTWLEAADPNKRLIVRYFRYAIDGNLQVLKQPFLAVWFRLSPKGTLRYKVVVRSRDRARKASHLF